jgi:Ser/Thr protein kinase RdoA (MazF antagonist)
MLLLAGCGGQSPPSAKALQQEATTLQSLAAEGGILASDAARGRSTSTFVRVHGTELTKAAQASERVLAEGRTPGAHALATLATQVGDALGRLSRSGSNRTQQRRLAAQLTRSATRTGQLAKRL